MGPPSAACSALGPPSAACLALELHSSAALMLFLASWEVAMAAGSSLVVFWTGMVLLTVHVTLTLMTAVVIFVDLYQSVNT